VMAGALLGDEVDVAEGDIDGDKVGTDEGSRVGI